MNNHKKRPLRITYAVQNVGGIDFTQDIGDTVPVKQTLLGLRRADHDVTCLKLQRRSVMAYQDVSRLDEGWEVALGISATRSYLTFESGVRRFQRMARLPYLALFDTHRFYEACMRCLPGSDFCHEHHGLFCCGAALASRRLKIPYVLTFSADPFYERSFGGRPMRGISGLLAAWEARFAYRLAKKIICVSEAAAQHLTKTWEVDPEKVAVLPNGVDLNLFRPDYDSQPVLTELGLNGKPVVGFVGGFQHWHGLDRLVESLAHIRKEIPNANLLLVGDGRARPSIEAKISEEQLDSAVVITGLIPQKRVPQFLAAADVAVLPYPQLPRELWFSPLKLYEYMSAGKAIVASNSGQIANVIKDGHNGLLVEAGNVGQLSQAIIKLLNDPSERARLGNNARQQAVSQHSWDRYIEQLEELYFDALSVGK